MWNKEPNTDIDGDGDVDSTIVKKITELLKNKWDANQAMSLEKLIEFHQEKLESLSRV